jgi:hypothetical protein
MANDLRLQVILQALDKASGPLNKIRGASKGVVDQLKKTRESLRKLDQAQKSIGEWRKLRAGTRELEQRMRGAQQRTQQLGKQLADARQRATVFGTGTRGAANDVTALAAQFDKARQESAQLKGEFTQQQAKLQTMRARLREAGIDTRQLGTAERTLRTDTASATERLQQQTAALKAQGEQARRVAALHERLAKGQAMGANLSIAGYASLSTGRHILGALAPSITQAGAWASESQRYATLGLGDKALKDAQALAKSMHYAGTSVVDNLELIRDAAAVFANEEHAAMAAPLMAKLKFANDTLYGQASGEARTRQFQDMLKVIDLRGGTLNQKSFNDEANAVQQVFNATAGRVAPEEWRALIQRGGVAAKLLDRKSFYYGMEPLVQEMGGAAAGAGLMSLYQNLYQGKSSLRAATEMSRVGLLDPGKVEYTKIGTIKQIRAGALRGGDLFTHNPQKWLETVMLPALAAHGITSRKDVLNEIGAIVGNRRGANLLSAMYTQREQIARSRNLSEHADTIEASAAKAELTPAGRLLQMHKQLDNLYTELGNDLLPVYISALRKLTGVLRALTGFAQRHPALAKGIALVAAGMGVLAVAAGGVMITLGALIGQFALLRFAMARAGMGLAARFGARAAAGAAEGAAGPALLTRMATAARGVFPAIGGMARAAALAVTGISLPVVLVVATLVTAALVIRKYWGVISAYIAGVGRGVREALQPIRGALAPLQPILSAIGTVLGAVWRWFTRLLQPTQATGQQLKTATDAGMAFGRFIGTAMRLVLQPILWVVQAFHAVGTAIGTAAGFIATHWAGIKDTLMAPFRAAFGWISAKLDGFMAKWQALRAFLHLGQPQTAGGPKIDWYDGSTAAPRWQVPLRAPGAGAAPVTNHYQLTVHAAPGQSPHSVATAVGAELDRRERAKAAAGRSRLGDIED